MVPVESRRFEHLLSVAGRKGTAEEYRAIAEDLMRRIGALKPLAGR